MKNAKHLKDLLAGLQDGSIDEKEVRKLLKQSGDLDDPDKKKEWLKAVNSLDQKQSTRLIPPVQPDADKQRFLTRLKQGTSQEKIAGSSASQSYQSEQSYPWLKVAAVVATVLVTLFIYLLSFHDKGSELIVHRTLPGQKSNIILPDGSTVQLNAESKLTYTEQFGAENSTREVAFEGEAFFNVKKDPERPFIVNTQDLKATVLGTSFNVKAYPDEQAVQVIVASGKVAVQGKMQGDAGGQKVLLLPNEMVSYHKQERKISKTSGDFADLLAWKEGKLIFNKVQIREAIPALERWYGVEIVLENEKLGGCLTQLQVQGESLYTVLGWLQFSMPALKYEIKNKTVFLDGEGCKDIMQ